MVIHFIYITFLQCYPTINYHFFFKSEDVSAWNPKIKFTNNYICACAHQIYKFSLLKTSRRCQEFAHGFSTSYGIFFFKRSEV